MKRWGCLLIGDGKAQLIELSADNEWVIRLRGDYPDVAWVASQLNRLEDSDV